MGGSRGDWGGGGAGGLDPPEKSQNIGGFSNIGPDPLKNYKIPSQHSILGHYLHASELNGVRWRDDDGPPIEVYVWIPSPLLKKT